jgi:hypothetical protein
LLFASVGGGVGARRLVIVAVLSLFSCNQSSSSIAIVIASPFIDLHCLFVFIAVITPTPYCLLVDCHFLLVVPRRCCSWTPSSLLTLLQSNTIFTAIPLIWLLCLPLFPHCLAALSLTSITNATTIDVLDKSPMLTVASRRHHCWTLSSIFATIASIWLLHSPCVLLFAPLALPPRHWCPLPPPPRVLIVSFVGVVAGGDDGLLQRQHLPPPSPVHYLIVVLLFVAAVVIIVHHPSNNSPKNNTTLTMLMSVLAMAIFFCNTDIIANIA